MPDEQMTVEDVRRRVEEVRLEAGDDEVAHSREDDLHRDVLNAVANGNPLARELAAEALKTEEIGFARWYA